MPPRPGTFSAPATPIVPFSIQSISKVFTLAMALRRGSSGTLWSRVLREPSGTSFNSLVQLEVEHGIPRNPFINAGALVVTDHLMEETSDAAAAVLRFLTGRRTGQAGSLHRRGGCSQRTLQQQPQLGTGPLPERFRQPAGSPPRQWWKTMSASAPS